MPSFIIDVFNLRLRVYQASTTIKEKQIHLDNSGELPYFKITVELMLN